MRLALLVAGALAACSTPAPTLAPGSDAGTTVAAAGEPAPVSPVPGWIEELRSPVRHVRETAIAKVARRAVRGELTGAEAGAVLDAAAALAAGDLEGALIGAVADAVILGGDPGAIAALERTAAAQPPRGRARILVALGGSSRPEAAAAMARMLERDPEGAGRALALLEVRPRPAIFPALLAVAGSPAIGADVLALAASYCRREILPAAVAAHADALLALRPTPALATLFACLPRKRVEPALRAMFGEADPDLLLAATRSLIAHRRDPPKGAYARLAERPETRAALFELLDGRRARAFPKRWRTQPMLAESVMVEWLRGRDGPGVAPEEIALVEVVPVDVGKPTGVLLHYVFRFRIDGAWMRGVAGPFRQAAAPTVEDHGGTWSPLEPERRTRTSALVDPAAVKAEWTDEAPGSAPGR